MATARAPAHPRYSYAQYLVYEADSEMKHEFEDGEIIARRVVPAPASGEWEYREATAGAVQLTSGVTLDLSRLYADLPD